MFSVSRLIVRTALIGGLAFGGLVLIAGPHRVGAMVQQARGFVVSRIDRGISDPVALRAQLRSLESQYPQRISAARSDLGEVRSQLAQLQRELSVAQRVMSLAESDTLALRQLALKADQAHALAVADGAPARVEVLWNGRELSPEQVLAKAAEAQNTRAAYAQRVQDVQRDLGHLRQQEDRLATLLTRLETERSNFQAQMWALDRQVDSIARNERMLAVLRERQRSIDEQSRYKASNLDAIQGKLADIRARQEGELASLAAGADRSDYESRAKFELDREHAERDTAAPAAPASGLVRPVIRVEQDPATQPKSLPGVVQHDTDSCHSTPVAVRRR